MVKSLTFSRRYTIDNPEADLLGEGGMGRVFLGQDTQVLMLPRVMKI